MVAGGVLAHRHLIPLWAEMAAASTGSFVADQLFFAAGRYFRDNPRVRKVESKPAFAKAIAIFEHQPPWPDLETTIPLPESADLHDELSGFTAHDGKLISPAF